MFDEPTHDFDFTHPVQDAVPATVQTPEIALLRAVLEDALDCYQKQFICHGDRVLRLAKEAEEWIFADEPGWTFSFVSCCYVVGLDPSRVRATLRTGKETGALTMQIQRRQISSAGQIRTE